MGAEWFPGRLRELRSARRLTQGQLAQAAGVSQRAVAQWERGVREPAWSSVVALAAALGVDCTAFLQQPAARPPAGPGRPPKASPAPTKLGRGEAPKKGKGRKNGE